MKKEYKEPVMVVEDFTVSEMVAGNCAIDVNKLHFCSEADTTSGCENGLEPWLDAIKCPEANEAFLALSSMYHGCNLDGDPNTQEYPFTEAHYKKSNNNAYICSFHDDIDKLAFTAGMSGANINCDPDDDIVDVNIQS